MYSSHLMLILPELADHLGLHHCCLHCPKTVDVAVDPSTSRKPTMLTEYVKFSVSSLDAQWTSRIVHALVAPGLCTSVILGLPWLEKNNIIADFGAQTCIDKKMKYDLLNPLLPVVPKQLKLQLKELMKQLQNDRKAMLMELKFVLALRLKMMRFEEVTAVDVVAAINMWIEQLSGLAELMHREDMLKAEFKDIFEPIPHVDELPMDVLAHIKLKEVGQSIKTQSYQCS